MPLMPEPPIPTKWTCWIFLNTVGLAGGRASSHTFQEIGHAGGGIGPSQTARRLFHAREPLRRPHELAKRRAPAPDPRGPSLRSSAPHPPPRGRVRSGAGGRRRPARRARAPRPCPPRRARRRWWLRCARARGRPPRSASACRRGRRRPPPRDRPRRRRRPPPRARPRRSGGRCAARSGPGRCGSASTRARFSRRDPWLPPKARRFSGGTVLLAPDPSEGRAHGIAGHHTLLAEESARLLVGAGGAAHEGQEDAVREAGPGVGLEDHRAHPAGERRGARSDRRRSRRPRAPPRGAAGAGAERRGGRRGAGPEGRGPCGRGRPR